ncbi:MAG: hypothetical protein ACOYVJ_07570 [Nitrospirota bacterium]
MDRTSVKIPVDFGYSQGNCAHCHEQHAMIGGSEPAPIGGGPSLYALFSSNHTSQTDNFCFTCHTEVNSFQSGGLVNRSYSYRAGGYTSDTLNDILEAFSFTYSPFTGSSHNLADIRTLVISKSWGYRTDSNPCGGCHNPHRAQRDPHASGSRGWPVSRPGQHNTNNNEWGLWGDNISDDTPYGASAESMRDYTTSYQAPYRFGSTTTYEPDGSAFPDGSNLTDYVTFCTDCHTSTPNSVWSSTLNRYLRAIDWDVEKHGKGNADGAISMDNPYGAVMGKVLACTDCHEPHGAPNVTLIRKEVNGGTLSAITTIAADSTCAAGSYTDYNATKPTSIANLCDRCHKDDYDFSTSCQNDHWYGVHHDSTSGDPFYTSGGCSNCHVSGQWGDCTSTRNAINCNCCHYHGSQYSTWRTF